MDGHEQLRGGIKRAGDLVLPPVLHCDSTRTVNSGLCGLFGSVSLECVKGDGIYNSKEA